ncbi:hypothetical protein [Devosia sp. SL43]|uniref:hypothetical protein n=1 Tax=Devosia sp. SL43 TaxID=2806348 RepID=UPI001F1A60A3|nr:hypothetical protein [Devosia sp. SL43]UJW84894.1 hypothetical protein IM737_15930 [Devosia sp. SL43]
MAQPNSTLFDELKAAARGCLALLVGDRQSSSYFDFSLRGLVGSFIAFLLVTLATAFLLPLLLGGVNPPGEATRGIISTLLLLAVKDGAAWLFLRQNGRLDGFVPLLVADNWVNVFGAIIGAIVAAVAGPSDIVLLGMGLMVIIIEVNIARLIVTLSAWQIAIFIVIQLVASSVGVFLLFAFGILVLPEAPLPA